MPETEMLRFEYQRITNQTKQAWLLNLLLIEQPFPLATNHKESLGNMQVEIHFYQPYGAFCWNNAFFGSFDKRDMEYE